MSEPFYIKVRVITNQKKTSIEKISENNFEISLREKPERGEANKKLLEILNEYFAFPQGGVQIINGQHNPIKLIKIGR